MECMRLKNMNLDDGEITKFDHCWIEILYKTVSIFNVLFLRIEIIFRALKLFIFLFIIMNYISN